MTNFGNTGQRYKMPKIMDVTTDEINGKPVIIWHLTCGHKRAILVTYDGQLGHQQEYIGKRTRCDQCTRRGGAKVVSN